MDRHLNSRDQKAAIPIASNSIEGTVAGHAIQIGTMVGNMELPKPDSTGRIPRQLPAAPKAFVGRRQEAEKISAALSGNSTTPTLLAIAGPGGIGKTWLAVHSAHQNIDKFPDGQLFLDLRGYAPTGKPMRVSTAVRILLNALSIEPAQIPDDLDSQLGLYRSIVSDKRILIILDNAKNSTQVSPLIPASPTCVVLVTSRDHLVGLVTTHGADPVYLDVLSGQDARRLLALRLGPGRLTGDTAATTDLVRFCAGLPLALGIVAGRALSSPNLPLSLCAAEQRDAATRLGALAEGDSSANLSTVFSWSYGALNADQAELIGLLSLAPGPDISLPAIASLIGRPMTTVRGTMRDLERVSLVQQEIPGRYRMHDLIRLYLTTRTKDDTASENAAHRLVDFYVHTAISGELILYPHRTPIELPQPKEGVAPLALADQSAAIQWFDSEYLCLLAAQQHAVKQCWHRAVWLLAWALRTFHWRQGTVEDQFTVWRDALTAADNIGDATAQATARIRLGSIYARLGQRSMALDHLHHALASAIESGSPANQANAHQSLASAMARWGEDRAAIGHAHQALEIQLQLDNPVPMAEAMSVAGWLHARLGEYDEAKTLCDTALALFCQHQHRDGEAMVLSVLALVAQDTGNLPAATSYLRQVLDLQRATKDAYHAAGTLDRLGQLHLARGNPVLAREAWLQARELYRTQRRLVDAERVRHILGQLGISPALRAD